MYTSKSYMVMIMKEKYKRMYASVLYVCIVAAFSLGVVAGMLVTAHSYDEAFESGYYMMAKD